MCRHRLLCITVLLPLTLIGAQEAPQQTIESLRTRPLTAGQQDEQKWQLTHNEDIGQIELVRKEPPPPTVTLATAQSFFYTDNILLTESDRIKSVGWNGWFNAVVIPYSTFRWTPSISVEQHLFRYNNSPASDFDAQILALGSALSLNEERSWSWNVSYSLWRLYSAHAGHSEFYKQGELANSLSWYRSLSDDESLRLRISTALAWRHVTPSNFDRLSAELGAGIEFYPIRSIQIFPFVNVAGRFYPTDTDGVRERRDFTVQSGAAVSWRPHKNLNLSASFTWVGNYSSAERLNYDVVLPILGIAANISF